MKFCSDCGSPGSYAIPEGDTHSRFICGACHRIHYRNPRIIAACIPIESGKILMCKRAIEPRKGFWTIPGGFLEEGECVEAGAVRETREEACAEVRITNLHAMYSIPHISQVYLVFLADLQNGRFAPGVESQAVELFSIDDLPRKDIAFSAVRFSLDKYIERLESGYTGTYRHTYEKDACSPSSF